MYLNPSSIFSLHHECIVSPAGGRGGELPYEMDGDARRLA